MRNSWDVSVSTNVRGYGQYAKPANQKLSLQPESLQQGQVGLGVQGGLSGQGGFSVQGGLSGQGAGQQKGGFGIVNYYCF